MTVNNESLRNFKARLQAIAKDIESQIESGRAATDTVTLDQSKVGRLSRMDALQQQHMAKSTQQNLNNRLRNIIKALRKIETGDYGYCDDCGDDIATARLEVQPEAAFCLSCQSSHE